MVCESQVDSLRGRENEKSNPGGSQSRARRSLAQERRSTAGDEAPHTREMIDQRELVGQAWKPSAETRTRSAACAGPERRRRRGACRDSPI